MLSKELSQLYNILAWLKDQEGAAGLFIEDESGAPMLVAKTSIIVSSTDDPRLVLRLVGDE